MEEKVENFVEVVASITMSKSLYLPVTEGMTKEKLLELAKREIKTPDQIIEIYKQALNHFGININTKVDLKDWDIDELEYVTEYVTPENETTI